MPNTLKRIGRNAFYSNELKEIDIPSSVTTIQGGAFAYNKITGNNALVYGRNSDGSVDYTTLNSYAGQDASGLVIPNTVKYRLWCI